MSRYFAANEIGELLGTTAGAIMASHGEVLVHFWAERNTYDQTMAAHLATLRERFAGRVAVFAADIEREENADLVARLGLTFTAPALVYFRNGIPERTRIGTIGASDLAALIEWWATEPPAVS